MPKHDELFAVTGQTGESTTPYLEGITASKIVGKHTGSLSRNVYEMLVPVYRTAEPRYPYLVRYPVPVQVQYRYDYGATTEV